MSASKSPSVTASNEFRRSWRITAAAFVGVAFGVNGFSYASFGTLVNPISTAFHRPISDITVWVTFLFFGNTIAAPIIGTLADKFGARRVILCSLPVLIIAWSLGGMIGLELWMLYAVGGCIGLLGTGAGPITYGRMVQSWFDSGRGTAMGIMSAGIGLANMVGPKIMQSVVDAHGWRTAFFVLAAVHLLPIPFAWFWLKERSGEIEHGKSVVETGYSIREVFRLRVFWYAAIAFALYGLCAGGVTVNLVAFMTEGGMPRSISSNYMMLLGACSLTGRLVTGYVIDRVSVGLVCAGMLVIEACAFSAFAHFGVSAVPYAIAVTGFAFGGEVSCMGFAISRYFGVKNFGAINGILSVVVGIGVGSGAPMISRIHEAAGSYSVPFLVGATMATVSAVFFALMALHPYYVEPAHPAVEPIAPPVD